MARYNNIPTYRTTQGKQYVGTTKYPDIPLSFNDIYVITTMGDRFDILAQQYYSDASLWWIISTANPQLIQNSYHIPEGTQLRIPQNIGRIKAEFNALNQI